MAGSKRVGLSVVGAIVWAGLCLLGPQTPWASERQTGVPGDSAAAGEERFLWRAEVQPRGEAEEICSQVQQPMTILFVAPQGRTVKKGDLLVEMDSSAFVDKRIQQVFQVRKAEAETARAARSRRSVQEAGPGPIDLAQRALRLAQGQLKAYTEGEYPHQLALAEGTAALADQRRRMLEYRRARLRAATEPQKDDAAGDALQEAEMALREAQMQSYLATSSLAMLKGIGHDNKVAELELAVAQREFELARAKTAIADANMQADIVFSLAEMSRTMEADRRARLDDQIIKCRIYAPQDGTIDQPRDADEAAVKPGAIVRERQVLLRLLPVAQSKP
jgi:hypothetical protein